MSKADIMIDVDQIFTHMAELKRDSWTKTVICSETNIVTDDDGTNTYLYLDRDLDTTVGDMFILSNFWTNAHLERINNPNGNYLVKNLYGKAIQDGEEYLLVCPSY